MTLNKNTLFKPCKCGCGIPIPLLDRKGRPHDYLSGHYTKTIDQKGDKNKSWKGDGADYSSVHKWIRRNYGTPTTCEHCQKNNLTGYQINWANRDHQYKRDREDWIRLCAKCHVLLDKKLKSNDQKRDIRKERAKN